MSFTINETYSKHEILKKYGLASNKENLMSAVGHIIGTIKFLAINTRCNPSFDAQKRTQYNLAENEYVYLVGDSPLTIQRANFLKRAKIYYNFGIFLYDYKDDERNYYKYLGEFCRSSKEYDSSKLEFYSNGSIPNYPKPNRPYVESLDSYILVEKVS